MSGAELGSTIVTVGEGDHVAILEGVVETGHVGSHLRLGQGVEGGLAVAGVGAVSEAPPLLGHTHADGREGDLLAGHGVELGVHTVPGLLEEGDVDGVVAELAVVGDDVVQGPGEVLVGVGGDEVDLAGLCRADGTIAGHVFVGLAEAELRTEGGAEGQAFEGLPHLAEVEVGVEGSGEVVGEVGEFGLAVFVHDGGVEVVAVREEDDVSVAVIRDGVGEEGLGLGAQGPRDGVGGAAGAVDTVLLVAEACVDGAAHGEPLERGDVDAGTEGIAVVFLADGGALVVHITEGHVSLHAVGTAGGAEGVLVGDTDAVGELMPVGGGHLGRIPGGGALSGVPLVECQAPALEDVLPCGVGEALDDDTVMVDVDVGGVAGDVGEAGIVAGPATPDEFLFGGHEGDLLEDLLGGECAGVVEGELAVLTTIGGDEDDTVAASCTVDGGCGGVLEDVDGLDILRVDHVEADGLRDDTVDDDERAAGRETIRTTDLDGTGGTRTSVVADHDAGGLTLEGFDSIEDRVLEEFFRFHGDHGTGHVALTHGTVTDGHRFFKHQAVVLEGDGHVVGGFDPLGHIADAGNFQNSSGSDAKFEVTVEVRDDTIGGAGHEDGGSDNRLAVGIQDFTPDGGLGECRSSHKEQSRGSRKRHQRFTAH